MVIQRYVRSAWPVVVCLVLLVAACEDKARIKSQEDRLAYSIGYSMGKNIQATLAEREDSPSVEHLLAGIRAAMQGSSDVMTDEEMLGILSDHAKVAEERAQQRMEQAAEDAKEAGDQYLAQNEDRDGVMALPSGVQYSVLEAGDGIRATIKDTVLAMYVGRFIDGTVFEETYESGEEIYFPVKRVIPGWQEVLMMMPVGSKWEVAVPSDLAYGKRGTPTIPPNSRLVFDIEVLGIKGKTVDVVE